MATLETRTSPAGTSHRIKWRQEGTFQSETFGAARKDAARNFKRDVELAGNAWPDGWIKGVGYRRDLDAPTAPDQPLITYAVQFARDKTGIQPDTRQRYARQATALALELNNIVAADADLDTDTATVQNLTDRHVGRWINSRESITRSKPKTIANWHGLLFQIMERAVDEGLRLRNPCTSTGKALPRADAYRTDEEMVFLTETEFALIADAMWPGLPDPDRGGQIVAAGTRKDRQLIVTAAGTGARWGELTALTPADCHLRQPKRRVQVQRAWKRNGTGEFARAGVGRFYLGAPKTRAGRRTIRVGAAIEAELLLAIRGLQRNDLIFAGVDGGRLDQAHFYEYRWQRAVALAQRNGLAKTPRFHDLRHTYAAWLISAGVPLPEIQRRLGHESIQTTVDVYGGLLEQAGDLADTCIDDALSALSTPAEHSEDRNFPASA
jgi:integrase